MRLCTWNTEMFVICTTHTSFLQKPCVRIYGILAYVFIFLNFLLLIWPFCTESWCFKDVRLFNCLLTIRYHNRPMHVTVFVHYSAAVALSMSLRPVCHLLDTPIMMLIHICWRNIYPTTYHSFSFCCGLLTLATAVAAVVVVTASIVVAVTVAVVFFLL